MKSELLLEHGLAESPPQHALQAWLFPSCSYCLFPSTRPAPPELRRAEGKGPRGRIWGWGESPLTAPMVAGAVVSRGTAGAPIRAEAVGLVFLILAALLRLTQVGGTQGSLTELAWGREAGQRGSRTLLVLFFSMTCALPMNPLSSGSLLPPGQHLTSSQ